jgi:hypothetical protein
MADLLQGSPWIGRLVNHVHPMIQMSIEINDAISRADFGPIHASGSLQAWFENHKGKLQHLPWPERLPHLTTIEPL